MCMDKSESNDAIIIKRRFKKSMSPLRGLNWSDVRQHYDDRALTHELLLELYAQHRVTRFAQLLLGISDPTGNYSADEHGIGPRMLSENRNVEQRVFDLANELLTLGKAREVPAIIKRAGLRFLGIGVGSEASCMLKPEICWVANTRTVWAHLLVKHNDDASKADEELRLYRDGDETSEMAYAKWTDIHATLEVALTRIGEEGRRQARLANIEPGTITYLWADAIAAYLYARYRGYKAVLRH
jgi:hypothetical protein